MELDERKKLILGAIIDSYISNAEPVGSRTIAKICSLGISPATVRNIMADLEEMGLLEQPHTSAGRIPSHLGYRIYVDQLMNRYILSQYEIAKMNAMLELRIAEVQDLIREITNIYSRFTNYAVLSSIPDASAQGIKHVQLIPLDEKQLMVILVMDKNIVKDTVISVTEPLDPRAATELSIALTNKLARLSYDELCAVKLTDAFAYGSGEYAIALSVLEFIKANLHVAMATEVFTGGTTNLLDFPEYNNITKAKRLLSYLEDKSNLSNVIMTKHNGSIKILIGNENEAIELQDCSLVLSNYKIGNTTGTIGIIGPTRMNYAKAVSNLDFFTGVINAVVERNVSDYEKETKGEIDGDE